MNALYGLAILATVVHGVLFDGSFWKIYGYVFASYLIFVLATMSWKENPKRKILMAATWNGKTLSLNLSQNQAIQLPTLLKIST
jgi:hypothetical protein